MLDWIRRRLRRLWNANDAQFVFKFGETWLLIAAAFIAGLVVAAIF